MMSDEAMIAYEGIACGFFFAYLYHVAFSLINFFGWIDDPKDG
jgi:hypothetical protein